MGKPGRALVPLVAIVVTGLLFLALTPLILSSPSDSGSDTALAHNVGKARVAAPVKRAGIVNPFIGTGAQDHLPPAYSGGETFPGADAPAGMVQWSPDTVSYAYSGYKYSDNRIRGFSLTHLSGPGCSEYGDIPFLPYAGTVTDSPATNPSDYTSTFSHSNESASAGYYKVQMDNGVIAELSATPHSGAGRFTYPAGQPESMLINLAGSLNGATDTQATIGYDTISGWANSGNFCYLKSNSYRIYFWAQFSQPFASIGTWQGNTVSEKQSRVTGQQTGVFVRFGAKGEVASGINVRVGVSFVSEANARANVDQENPTNNFDSIQQRTVQVWNQRLDAIQVSGGSLAQLTTFYTALYHTLLFPSIFSDDNGQYIGFDGQVHRVATGHIQYANFSGWDTYRSEMQLLTLLEPAEASDMAQSLVNDYAQGGILPRWSIANGDTYVQVGDSSDALIADVYAFGGTSFDTGAALAAMIGQATEPNSARPGLDYLANPGYEPLDGEYGCCNAYGPAATTLEYSTDDFSISAFAHALGNQRMASLFLQRAQNWRHLFDPASGYLEPRNLDGSFPTSYSLESNLGWVEGNSAQYTWLVPFNLHDLFTDLGGNARVVERLDTFFTRLDAGLDVPYAFLGNEPTFEVPWEYDYAGAPYKTQQVVRQIVNTLYAPGPAGLPGNDDLGEMSSWYVFAALGMYPETPGTADLALASPLFPHIIITRSSGQLIQINAPGASASTYYVQGLSVNGQVSTQPWLASSFIAHGGSLDYRLASTPDPAWGASASAAPPSYR